MVDFSSDLPAEVVEQFGEDEVVMFQDPIVKYSVTSPGEERLYLMTTENIYVFRGTMKSREYAIKDVSAIFKSNDNDDFILFFEATEDLHASSKKREELL